MADVTDDVVTSGQDGVDPQVRAAWLNRRLIANPEKIGLRLRLAQVLEEAGQLDEALRLSAETAARFPNSKVARMRLVDIRRRVEAASTPMEGAPGESVSANETLEPAAQEPIPAAEPALSDPTQEHRFAAQDELLHLARAAGGAHDSAAQGPAVLQAEPSVRLRLNPLHPRYRAEIYIAAGLITVIVLSGVLAWHSPGSGLLIDHGAPTPIVLAPSPAAPVAAPAAPATLPVVTLAPVAVPHTAPRSELDGLAAVPSRSVPATPPPLAAPPAEAALPALPEATALPEIVLAVPAGDPGAAREAADWTTRLQGAGMTVRPAQPTGTRQPPGIAYFYAEDAALARTVAAVLGEFADRVHQSPVPPGTAMLPGAIRITLPALPRHQPRQGGPQ